MNAAQQFGLVLIVLGLIGGTVNWLTQGTTGYRILFWLMIALGAFLAWPK
jgi:hypothetical protein